MGEKKKISTVTAATNPACATLHGSVGPPLMEVNKTSAPKISIKTKAENAEMSRIESRRRRRRRKKNGHYEFQK